MIGQAEQYLLVALVLGSADGKTLSTCCCVSKLWLGLARDEQFWKALCFTQWPSSASVSGISTIKAVGGYRKYYALRFQAQENVFVLRGRKLKPRLGMGDLIMFLDVVYQGTSICSLVKKGEQLEPLFTCPNTEQGVFRFVLDFPELKASRPPNRTTPSERLENWTRQQVTDLEISWAVMENSSHKILSLLQANKGVMVGSTCTFKYWLPVYSSSPSVDTDHVAEVDVMCKDISRGGTVAPEEGPPNAARENSLMTLDKLKFGFMICQEWRYFSQLQARRYLQHIFDHEM